MSLLIDRSLFFRRKVATFAGDLGVVSREDRGWEESYRNRWGYDKRVRSTHGVNCTGSCSWEVYVKNGIITWEMQALDYPPTRPDLPNHEPHGCPRGATASWYVYSNSRIKHPLVRRRLIELWRATRRTLEPVDAWRSIVENAEGAAHYKRFRGRGGFVRVSWEEINELIAATTVYTTKTYGPDRVAGFAPIPAYSMVSYGAGTRFLSLLGGTCLSFYDWYCDLPPSSPMTWGEQTGVPESAAWYDSAFLILWGSNVPQTRSPDAHFYTEVRYKGTKTVVISPDFNEAAKFADLWLHPKQRTDAALALAMGHVILKEFHVEREVPYFKDYVRRYSDLPLLVRLKRQGDFWVAERFLRAADFTDALGQRSHPDWKTVGIDEQTDRPVVPLGSIGFRWGEAGKWNLEERDGRDAQPIKLRLSLLDKHAEIVAVAFPYFGTPDTVPVPNNRLIRNLPVRRLALQEGETLVATVYDLLVAHYGIDRGLGGEGVGRSHDGLARSYDDAVPYTPAWQERITGIERQAVINVAREFAQSAAKTQGRAKVIIGCGVNQAYHTDMAYRAVITLLVLCGCVGQPGGGWAHYVGQEKIRPLVGWSTLSFALDWTRPPRQMNSTSYFYAHTDQFRYETVTPADLLSPLAEAGDWGGSLIDFNVRAERMGWLPSSPQLQTNPLQVARDAAAAGQAPAEYIATLLKSGQLRLSCEDPDNPLNFPRVLLVWRSNLLGASAKGHEYFLCHLLGAPNGVDATDVVQRHGAKPREVVWHETAPEGKLDLLVTLDFRMSSTGMYADVVLPAATWYEKDDLNTTDLHPFIHPLGAAVDPVWEARTDWDIFKGLAHSVAKCAVGHLGVEHDVVLVPIQHDSPAELAQSCAVHEWKKGECEPVPGKTMPGVAVVERDYPNLHAHFTALGPLVVDPGVGAKGIHWSAATEVELLQALNGVVEEGVAKGLPRLETAVQACETILLLSPETNGEVALRAWETLGRQTGRDSSGLAAKRANDKIHFQDLVVQPRKVISSPIWSGIESERLSYTAFYTNVHEQIPWRTLTGRQQLYLDHPWIRAFGEGFMLYRPPLDTKAVELLKQRPADDQPVLLLNFLTPHQKWSIYSTYTETLLLLTLARGGPVIWLNEEEARRIGIADNDWIEAFNGNGALTARAILSQRVMPGTCMMYHAQEKLVNTPQAPSTGSRGIHNSVTRVIPKPTHMIGGYAQFSYGFNYFGTIGSNRDDIVLIRKLTTIDWLDEPMPQNQTAG